MSVRRICEDCSSLARTSPCGTCMEARERLADIQKPGAWNERIDDYSDEYET